MTLILAVLAIIGLLTVLPVLVLLAGGLFFSIVAGLLKMAMVTVRGLTAVGR